MSLTAAAEVMAEDTQAIGLAASMTAAQAWAAGVDPEATRGLISAALTLGCGETPPDHGAPPVRTDRDLASTADLLESDAADMLAAVRKLQEDIGAAAAAAAESMRNAREGKMSAGEIAQANQLAAMALADCDCASEIAEDLAARLEWAIARLAEVPQDIEAVYEPVYDLLARGGQLTYAGGWLTALLEAS